MQFINPGQKISPVDEHYACEMTLLRGDRHLLVNSGDTVYGYVITGHAKIDRQVLAQGQYFSWTSWDLDSLIIKGQTEDTLTWCVVRRGFRGQCCLGDHLESRGRLTYIDGCSDSLLIYPPRLGDPSLNFLVFPPGVDQTYHTHPSARYGLVIKGAGWADQNLAKGPTCSALVQGQAFYLPTLESHRFRTEGDSMWVLAFHPDGDWGPTDHDHTMLNRTYLDRT